MEGTRRKTPWCEITNSIPGRHPGLEGSGLSPGLGWDAFKTKQRPATRTGNPAVC